jgi:hypothetical protein
MSLEHKAFIFDAGKFSNELKPHLEADLRAGKSDQVRAFIISNISSLTDPYEGEELDECWEDMIENKDAHQYGDFALTKYYSPTADVGLGAEWKTIQELLTDMAALKFSPVLGKPLKGGEEVFDPGKMGAYFQTSADVVESLNIMNSIEQSIPKNVIESFNEFKAILKEASKQDKGLYVTF